MNATAMVSVDGAAAAGKPRSAATPGEPAAPPEDQGFAGLLCPSAQAASADEAPNAPDAAVTADATEQEQASAEQEGSCATQVLALLGLSAPATDPAAAASAALQAETRTQALGAGQAMPTGRATLLADVLETTMPGNDSRGGLRTEPRGSLATGLDATPAVLLTGAAIGLDPVAVETPTLQATQDPSTGALVETQRPRGASTTPAASSPQPSASLQQPVGTPAWRDELGTRLAMMVDQGEQLATLHLTPDELGPVEVRLTLREGEATVWFTAQAGETRAALEQALPRLREMFASGGLALAHAAVNADTSRDAPRPAALAGLPRNRRGTDEGGPEAVTTVEPLRRGLLDLYA